MTLVETIIVLGVWLLLLASVVNLEVNPRALRKILVSGQREGVILQRAAVALWMILATTHLLGLLYTNAEIRPFGVLIWWLAANFFMAVWVYLHLGLTGRFPWLLVCLALAATAIGAFLAGGALAGVYSADAIARCFTTPAGPLGGVIGAIGSLVTLERLAAKQRRKSSSDGSQNLDGEP